MAHVTGGGLAANLTRVLPDTVSAVVDRGTWQLAPIFELVRDVGNLTADDVEQTLNMGVGMVAVIAPGSVDPALAALAESGIHAWICGEVTDQPGGSTRMAGVHA